MNVVSDTKVVINVQGIRSVTWGQRTSATWGTASGTHFVTITYKGSHNTFYYPDESSALSIFNKIRAAMDRDYRDRKAAERAGQVSIAAAVETGDQ